MTDKFPVKISWRESFDNLVIGDYFLAVRYPHGFGAYDVAKWNGKEWELGYDAEIVGWAPLDEMLGMLDAGWPAGNEASFGKPFAEQFEKHRRENPVKDSDKDDFIEV